MWMASLDSLATCLLSSSSTLKCEMLTGGSVFIHCGCKLHCLYDCYVLSLYFLDICWMQQKITEFNKKSPKFKKICQKSETKLKTLLMNKLPCTKSMDLLYGSSEKEKGSSYKTHADQETNKLISSRPTTAFREPDNNILQDKRVTTSPASHFLMQRCPCSTKAQN